MSRFCTAIRIILLCPLLTLPASFADQRTANWSGDFAPCQQRSELAKHNALRLGVKISTANPELASAFRSAMHFWSQVIDMDWYEEPTSSCALQVVDGTPEILKSGVVARAQFLEWDNFQGLIAFNPRTRLTSVELYLTAVHEIGHMLGLKHNPNVKSVMYYLDLQGSEILDQDDLARLARRHKLRVAPRDAPIAVSRLE